MTSTSAAVDALHTEGENGAHKRGITKRVRDRVGQIANMRGSQVDSHKEELFEHLADEDGNIHRTAFSKLFDVVREDVVKEQSTKKTLQSDLKNAHRRARVMKIVVCFALFCMIVLLGGNAGLPPTG